ncbi:sulfatase [Salinarchaeum sp. Harcht-Bsk1]|uniref:sulfatase n=1 Tax=Salinarchaeum sp. Harcht-Bsk1 TaxID=1333523 RepID=UPI00067798F8|nr:sulfatase [Salinarchaeum sp. Harcht-Bsk1]
MTDTPPVSNVLLVTVDSLRADALGAYDPDRRTPIMDELAADGTLFEHAYATGNWTPFSFPSMLASRHVFEGDGSIGVDAGTTLASVLSEAGFDTAGFNAANGFLSSHWGYDAGFDEFDSFVANVGDGLYGRYLATHPTVEAWLQVATAPFRRVGKVVRRQTDDRPFLDTARMFDVEHAATDFLEDAGEDDDPFFLWVHYMDVHTPYVPAKRYVKEVTDSRLGLHRKLLAHTYTGLGWEVGDRTLEDLRTLYQATVRQVDASIGRLLDTLDVVGHADDTAVVLAGDHGEEFQEHGHLSHYPKLYDELMHVPYIVDVPGAESRRIEQQVGLDTIPPTAAELVGVEGHPDWRGTSLVPTILDGETPPNEPVISVTVRGETVTTQPIPRTLDDGDLLVSVRDGPWTYIENVETGETELYDRRADPTQQTNLADDPTPEQRDVIDRLASIAEAHVTTLGDGGDAAGDDEVDDAVEARLTALGYQ